MSKQNKLTEAEILDLQRQQLKLLQMQYDLEQGLPHLYGFPWYKWAKEFFESTNRENFLTAANQASKSSTMIRKFIHWATEPKLWTKLWPSLINGQVPNQFWYMYPTQEVATIEFETKWLPLFLPRNKYKDHPQYGWKDEWDKGMIRNITFNSGVTIYFKTYSQKAKDLQTGTVYLIGLDEECPVDLLPELQARLNATDGYLCSVFTATMGQLYWEQVMERRGKQDERHKDALKLTVSLFDCLTYEDGSASHWTEDKIRRAIARCPNEAEVQRRIYGRFVKSQGLMYESFSLEKNTVDGHPLPEHWHIYSGVDVGSGGMSGHPAAIIFVAVSPDYKRGRVFKGWRGDGVPTTSEDILNKYRELLGKLRPIQQTYDYAAKDFFTIASRKGLSFTRADKDRAVGIGLLNTLFKTEMLKIHSNDGELQKLISELSTLSVTADKRKASDDMIDALRYCIASIPWDFSDIEVSSESEALKEIPKAPEKTGPEIRREWFMSTKEVVDDIDAELDFWNEQGGAF